MQGGLSAIPHEFEQIIILLEGGQNSSTWSSLTRNQKIDRFMQMYNLVWVRYDRGMVSNHIRILPTTTNTTTATTQDQINNQTERDEVTALFKMFLNRYHQPHNLIHIWGMYGMYIRNINKVYGRIVKLETIHAIANEAFINSEM